MHLTLIHYARNKTKFIYLRAPPHVASGVYPPLRAAAYCVHARANYVNSGRLHGLRAAELRGVRGGRVPVAGAPELHGVSVGLGDVCVHEREQRAALPVPAGLRERDGAVRGVRGGFLQRGISKCLVHALRGALENAGDGQRERERVRV